MCALLCLTLQTHGLKHSRLLCPWNFPGKNTGVCCHFLLQGIFPTQGSNPQVSCVGRRILCYHPTWEALCRFCCSVVQSCPPFATPWTAARQASLSFTIFQSLLKLMSIKSVTLSNHLVLCHPLLLLPSIVPSIRVFSSESVLHIRWPEY